MPGWFECWFGDGLGMGLGAPLGARDARSKLPDRSMTESELLADETRFDEDERRYDEDAVRLDGEMAVARELRSPGPAPAIPGPLDAASRGALS
jgi:hypothetical protein